MSQLKKHREITLKALKSETGSGKTQWTPMVAVRFHDGFVTLRQEGDNKVVFLSLHQVEQLKKLIESR